LERTSRTAAKCQELTSAPQQEETYSILSDDGLTVEFTTLLSAGASEEAITGD